MRAWTVVCSALDGAGAAKTLRFSDNKYIDASKNSFIKRLVQPALITVSPTDGGVLNIFATPSIGEIELINTDGSLDYLADYAFDGRNLVVALMQDVTVLKTATYTAGKLSERNGRLFISLRTLQDTLNTEHPFDKYLGNNSLPAGLEGVEGDIKGNNKYKVLGDVRNLTPVLCNTSKLIYQASSYTTTLIGGVRDNGAPLTRETPDYASAAAMEATAPAAGYYKCFQGYFRLGANPIGEITNDAYAPSALAGDVLDTVLAERSGTLNATSKSTLNSVGDIGILLTSSLTTWAIIEEIARSTGSYIYIENNIVYARLLSVSGTPTWKVKPHQVIRIERTSTGLGSNGLPIATIEMQADFIETTQKLLDGTVVTMADVARYKEQSRKVTATDSAVLTRHPLAETLKIQSRLRSLTAAQTVIDRILLVVKSRRDRVAVDLQFDDFGLYAGVPAFTLGDRINIKSNYLGYSAGRDFTIIGYAIDLKKNKITLELVG